MPPRKDPDLAHQVADAIRSRAAGLGLRTDVAAADYLARQDPSIFTGEPKRTLESWVRERDPALPREQTRWKIARAMDIPPERLGLSGPRAEFTEAQLEFVTALTEADELIRSASRDLDAAEGLTDASSNAVTAALSAIGAAIDAEKMERELNPWREF
jgi:hypothetical protein